LGALELRWVGGWGGGGGWVWGGSQPPSSKVHQLLMYLAVPWGMGKIIVGGEEMKNSLGEGTLKGTKDKKGAHRQRALGYRI